MIYFIGIIIKNDEEWTKSVDKLISLGAEWYDDWFSKSSLPQHLKPNCVLYLCIENTNDKSAIMYGWKKNNVYMDTLKDHMKREDISNATKLFNYCELDQINENMIDFILNSQKLGLL